MVFNETKPELLTDNPFKLIGTDWMLITAGTPESFNTMTASWGGLGILWERKVATCFIRPTRYTFEFAERSSSLHAFLLRGAAPQGIDALRHPFRPGYGQDQGGGPHAGEEGRIHLFRRGPAGAGMPEDLFSRTSTPGGSWTRRSKTCIPKRITTGCTSARS